MHYLKPLYLEPASVRLPQVLARFAVSASWSLKRYQVSIDTGLGMSWRG